MYTVEMHHEEPRGELRLPVYPERIACRSATLTQAGTLSQLGRLGEVVSCCTLSELSVQMPVCHITLSQFFSGRNHFRRTHASMQA